MKLTLDFLKQHNACTAGVKWAIDNKLIGMPLDMVPQIQGDYNMYIDWLSQQINTSLTYDQNNNLIHSKDSDNFEYWQTFDQNNNLIHYKSSIGREYWKTYDQNNTLIYHIDSNGYEEKHTVEYYPDGQLKQYDNLFIPFFEK